MTRAACTCTNNSPVGFCHRTHCTCPGLHRLDFECSPSTPETPAYTDTQAGLAGMVGLWQGQLGTWHCWYRELTLSSSVESFSESLNLVSKFKQQVIFKKIQQQQQQQKKTAKRTRYEVRIQMKESSSIDGGSSSLMLMFQGYWNHLPVTVLQAVCQNVNR